MKSVDSYASWNTYQAIDSRYGYNIVCGPGSNTKVNRKYVLIFSILKIILLHKILYQIFLKLNFK